MQTTEISGSFLASNTEVPHWTASPECKVAPVAEAAERGLGALDKELLELVDQAKGGDRKALGELLQRVRPRAMSVALKVLHNPDDAQDAVQDAFVKVWKNLDSFEGRSSFTTWLHRIVMNASLDMLRRIACRPDQRDNAEDEDGAPRIIERGHDVTPEREVGDREVAVLVRGAVRALPVAHRQALELREFDDLAYDEMAEEIQCPIGTVMSRLHNARKRLADDLRAPLADLIELYAA